MQRFLLSFYVLGAVVDALAGNKPLQGSRHAETMVVEDSSVRLDHNSSGQLDDVGGLVHWGKCSKSQLKGDWKPLHSDRCINANLVYVRIPKCASTTFSSVLRRVSARYGVSGVAGSNADNNDGIKLDEFPEPFLTSYHEAFRNMSGLVSKATLPTVKVTMLREPMDRILSQFYYAATHHSDVKEMGLLKFLKGEISHISEKNVMFSYLRPEGEMDVHKVMGQYDIIGVTERFDESVVLLMEKFGLSYCDVMYSNGKITAQSKPPKYDGDDDDGRSWVEPIPFSKQPKEIRDFLRNEFQEEQKYDYLAYNFAQNHMDLLIGLIGRDKFEAKVKDFTKWKEHVLDKCEVVGSGYRDNIVDKDWRESNCYAGDFGCGYKCFDAFCKNNPK